jgi:hypothetical protein
LQQFDLFRSADGGRPDRLLIDAVVQSSTLFVLPCGRRKASATTEARRLYASPRFEKLRRLAEDFAVPYRIASARHGLLAPEALVAPYDLDLMALSHDKRSEWAAKILEELEGQTDGEIVLLLSGAYAESILRANDARAKSLKIYCPFAAMSAVAEDEWIRQANELGERFRDLRKLYGLIDLARQRGETFLLRELSDQSLPERGVYIFIDRNERNVFGDGYRIVRIGTHGVSRGSKSTLRDRLRNHMGPSQGAGGHRGSVFRLHVGRAMLEAQPQGWGALPTWGVGQQASKDILEGELAHERLVTKYLGELEVFILPINDEPSKNSLRAKVETQLIGLMSADDIPIECPSTTWLGLHSPMPTIAATGLWNIRDVGRPYGPSKTGSVTDLINSGII